MVMQRSFVLSGVTSMALVYPAFEAAMMPALVPRESVRVDLSWSMWAITDMFLMLSFLSMHSRTSSVVKLTVDETAEVSPWFNSTVSTLSDPTGDSSLCLVPFACPSLFLPRQDAGWVTAAPSVRVTLSGIYDMMSWCDWYEKLVWLIIMQLLK